MGIKIGIDLGATYSCVSYVDENGIAKIVENTEGELSTPSVVYFAENGEVTVGSTARMEGGFFPDRMVECFRNFMGNPNFIINIDGNNYSAAAVSSVILKKLVRDAKMYLGGEEIDGAVITCPSYFNDAAREATKAAGEAAGLNVLKIIDEPMSAGLAYCNSRQEDIQKTVLIYDLGGETFNCTVLKIDFQSNSKKMETITTGGDHQLGGKDWDARLAEYVRNEFAQRKGISVEDINNDVELRAWIFENIEKAKKLLTSKTLTSLSIFYSGEKQKIEITRAVFEAITADLLEKTFLFIDEILSDKGLSVKNDIDEIILVGGSSKMPQVQKYLEQVYNKPINIFEPELAVAMGAALVADGIQNEKKEIVIVNEDKKETIISCITDSRTPDELNNPEYNYYLSFSIDPVEDDVKKIETVMVQRKCNFTQGTPVQRRLKDLYPEAVKIMTNYDAKDREFIEAKRFKLKNIENAVIAIAKCRGVIYKSDLIKMADASGKWLTADEIEKKITYLQQQGVKIIDDTKRSLDFLTYDKIEKLLKTIGKNDLYDLLGQNNSVSALQNSVTTTYNSISGKTDPKSIAINQVYGEAKKVFKDDNSKKYYDIYLATKDIWSEFALRRSTGISEMELKEFLDYSERAKKALKTSDVDYIEILLAEGLSNFRISVAGGDRNERFEAAIVKIENLLADLQAEFNSLKKISRIFKGSNND